MSENTKFLYVSGDDYASLIFEDNFDAELIYNDMYTHGETKRTLSVDDEFEDEPCEIEVELLTFKSVDKEFEEFIRTHIMDYDTSKSINFYRVGEN